MDKRDYQLMHTKSFKDQKKLDDELALHKVKCEHCGHTMVMIKVDRIICSHCGYWVYKDEKAKFKYKIKEGMIKNV